MIEENWKYWIPSEGITSSYVLANFTYGSNGVTVILEHIEGGHPIYKLDFGESTELCRILEERSATLTYSAVTKNKGKDFFVKKSFFIVENSKLIEWLKEESGYLEHFDLKHFVLMNDDSVFDIVAQSDPEIEIIENT